MIESQKEKLKNRTSEYLSIGITEDGVPRVTIGVPWEATSHAYNMRLPDIYLSPEDLADEETMRHIASYKVIGCYIWAPLDDYSFLARLKYLEDINIKNGDLLHNLDFLTELHACRMFYLQNAKLKDLNVIIDVKKKSKNSFGCLRCIGLDNCEVEDMSAFEKEDVHFSEFLIWNHKSRNERRRWGAISAGTKRYYEFDYKA